MDTVTASVSLSAIRTLGASWVVEQRSRMTRIERSEITSCLLQDVSWPCPPYEGIMPVPPPALWQPEPTQTQQFPWPGDTSVVSYSTQHRQGREIGLKKRDQLDYKCKIKQYVFWPVKAVKIPFRPIPWQDFELVPLSLWIIVKITKNTVFPRIVSALSYTMTFEKE